MAKPFLTYRHGLECCFILSEPGRRVPPPIEIVVCGRPVKVPGGSYCDHHNSLCYVPASRRAIEDGDAA